MAIHDSNPDRRNLIILSLSIIIFYAAEGELNNSDVRLQVINVTFKNPEMLIFFVWLFLIWFCYRYWLTSKSEWRKPLYGELKKNCPTWLIDAYLPKRFSLPKDDFSRSQYKTRHWTMFDHRDGTDLRFIHVGRSESNAQTTDHRYIEGIADKVFVFVCCIVVGLRQPTLTGQFVPYVLFIVAIFFGIYNHYLPCETN